MEFKHPCNIIVAGPTKAGKTTLVKNIISNVSQMFSPSPQQIWWCYNEWQPLYNEVIDKVKWVDGIPDFNEIRKSTDDPQLLVLDDLMQDVKQSSLTQIFSRGTHHGNISCIHIVQNVFHHGLRSSRINAQYIILLKNPPDKLQALNLAKQIFPSRQQYFMESYDDACVEPFGYLLIDLSQDTAENMRLRTNIFPGQWQVVYVPKV